MHREARRHQDDRVDEGEVDRELEALRRPAVVPDHDPVEEVDAEERAEEHRLRRDEEVHAEQARVDARALVRRAAARGRARRVRRPTPLGRRLAPRPGSTDDVRRPGSSDPLSIRPTTSRRSQPEVASGNVETMISSTCSSWTALSAAVTGSASPMWPVASTPASRRAGASARSSRSCTPGSSAGATSVNSVGAACAALADRLEQRPAHDRLVRDHEHVRALPRRGRGRPRRARPGCPWRPCAPGRRGRARSQLERTGPGASR